jgi:hypothetical protein
MVLHHLGLYLRSLHQHLNVWLAVYRIKHHTERWRHSFNGIARSQTQRRQVCYRLLFSSRRCRQRMLFTIA